MPESSVSQIESNPKKPASVKSLYSDTRRRIVVPSTMVAFGFIAGLVSLALVSNLFGNTDTVGLILFGCSGWLFVTGICYFFLRLRYAALVGVFAAPLSVALLFILYWVALFATGYQNRDHQDFAASGVSQIQYAKQMDELYGDCRHFVTYGQNDVPLFNSVAYFGDRYELTMQVPVRILSKKSGTTIGEPKFYLNEVKSVSVSTSGQVGASFSDSLNFGAGDWQRVYESSGDFSKIGFIINTTGVPNFKKYTDASRPSD